MVPFGSSRFEDAGEGESLEDLIKKFCSHFDVEFDIEFDSKKRLTHSYSRLFE